MANEILNRVRHYTAKDMSPTEKSLLTTIADLQRENGYALVSIPTLAVMTSQTERNVYRKLHHSEGMGRIIVKRPLRKWPGGRGIANYFSINPAVFPPLPSKDNPDMASGFTSSGDGGDCSNPDMASGNPDVVSINPDVVSPQPIEPCKPNIDEFFESSETPACIDGKDKSFGQNPTKRISTLARVDGVPTQRSLEEVLKSFEQSGGRLGIRDDKVWVIEYPPGDHKNHPDLAFLRETAKGSACNELMALLRNRGTQPLAGQEF